MKGYHHHHHHRHYRVKNSKNYCKDHIGFKKTQCISDPYFVLFYVCDLHYFDVVLCSSLLAPNAGDATDVMAAM